MKFVNIVVPGTNRQALNVAVNNVADAVRPWFKDFDGDYRVRQAINHLKSENLRANALEYLGIELQEAA